MNSLEILTILGLILLNGVFSMSEIALVSSRKVKLESAAATGTKGAKIALGLYLSPTYFFSTVQIGITLIGLLTGIFSGQNLTNNLQAYYHSIPLLQPIAHEAAITSVLLAVTFLSLVLGELIPKRIGLSHPERIISFMAPFMFALSKVTFPFVWLLTRTSDLLIAILGLKNSKTSNITEEEIKAIVRESAQGGEVEIIEQHIVERVFSLGDRKISSLMTHRADIVFIDLRLDAHTLREIVKKELHRVYPVYETDKDKIIGVLTLKDFFVASLTTDFDIRSYLKPATYLDQATSAYKALEQFKSTKTHYALVTDEYGLVIGIITLSDILEALVGNVAELRAEDFPLVQREDGSWLVDGQFPIADFLHHFGVPASPETERVNTLGGLLLRLHDRIPQAGDILVWKDLKLEIMDMDGVKIDKVLVKRAG
ncbi:MAG: HlyC/CorC family transporter [Cyclobacteriaceae bacterium]|nr:HlyC/CorC family transporter [Cyclobacteriaceae bacterium]